MTVPRCSAETRYRSPPAIIENLLAPYDALDANSPQRRERPWRSHDTLANRAGPICTLKLWRRAYPCCRQGRKRDNDGPLHIAFSSPLLMLHIHPPTQLSEAIVDQRQCRPTTRSIKRRRELRRDVKTANGAHAKKKSAAECLPLVPVRPLETLHGQTRTSLPRKCAMKKALHTQRPQTWSPSTRTTPRQSSAHRCAVYPAASTSSYLQLPSSSSLSDVRILELSSEVTVCSG